MAFVCLGLALLALPQVYAQTVVPLDPAFNFPRGIVVDKNGNLFVADNSSNGQTVSAIRMITAITSSSPITPYPYSLSATYVAGSSVSQSPFDSIEQMAIDSNGVIYAVDPGLNFGVPTMWKIAPPYTSASSISAITNFYQIGSGTTGDGGEPVGIALDSSGDIFISDSFNAFVTEFKAPNYTSSVTIYAGVSGTNAPTGLATDGNNNLFVADGIQNTVQAFTGNGYGTVNTIYTAPLGGFLNSIAALPDGDLIVVNDTGASGDSAANSTNVVLLEESAQYAAHTINVSTFNPNHVAIDQSGNIFVTNTGSSTPDTGLVDEILLGVTVSSVSPTSGDSAGGNSVTIAGSNFTNSYLPGGRPTVLFGNASASTFVINSDTSITATAPTGTAGTTVDVTVTTADGKSFTSANDRYTYGTPPTATLAIAFEALTEYHQTPFVPVTGAGGSGTLSYSIAPPLPSGLSISSSTGAITGTPTSTLADGFFTVTVSDSDDATAAASFALTVNPPVTATQEIQSTVVLFQNQAVTPFTPVQGSGGTGSLVYSTLDGLPAGLSINSSTGQITGTPSTVGPPTTYTVSIADSNGAQADNSFIAQVQAPVPAVTGVTPSNGPAGGGTTVSISGRNFTGANFVHFGGIAASGITVVSPTFITALSPPGVPGTVDVTVTAQGGTSATTVADLFTYVGTPSISLNTISSPFYVGPASSITATFTTVGGAPAPAQQMNFYDGATLLGSAPLTSSSSTTYSATLTGAYISPGSQTIAATYPGDSFYTTASSLGQTVDVVSSVLWIGNPSGPSTTSAFAVTGAPYLTPEDSAGGAGVAIDQSGNVWSLNAGTTSVAEFTSNGTITNTGYTSGDGSFGTSLAIDGSNQVWVTNSDGILSLFNFEGDSITPALSYMDELDSPTSIAIDISGNLWIANNGDGSVTKVLGAATPTVPLATGVAGNAPAATP